MPTGGRAGVEDLPWVRGLQFVADAINRDYPPLQGQTEPLVPPLRQLMREPREGLQHRISQRIFRHQYDRLQLRLNTRDVIALGMGYSREGACLQSCRGPGASGWLQAFPFTKDLTIEPKIFCAAARLRLGIAFPVAPISASCPGCKQACDVWGDRFLKCGHGKERIGRHDALVATFYRIFKEAKLVGVKKEQLLRTLGIPSPQRDPSKQRIDLLAAFQDGSRALFDVCGTHPCHGDRPFEPKNRSNRRPGTALHAYESRKRGDWDGPAQQGGYKFYPLAFESFGRWSKTTEDLLHLLGKDLREAHFHDDPNTPTGAVVFRWWCLLSVSLQKHNFYALEDKVEPPTEANRVRPFPADDIWGRGPFRPH